MSTTRSTTFRRGLASCICAIPALLGACTTGNTRIGGDYGSQPVLVAESADRQWTGVAWIGESGDLVVNYPRWTDQYTNAVEFLRVSRSSDAAGVERLAYPDRAMNRATDPETLSPSERGEVLIAVQAVHTDARGRLWILDTGNPGFGGVLEGAPKLVMVNPSTGRVERTYRFNEDVALEGSYLNDVRIHTELQRAYITDSGIGGLIVVDLNTARARRVLDGHPATMAEPGFTPIIGGRRFTGPDGETPQIHADGIAISPDGRHLYWQALTARTLYRLPTRLLADFNADDDQLSAAIQDLGRTVVTDGMAFDGRGNLYFTALEHDAVMYRTPTGEIRTLWSSPDLAWPDSFSYDPVRDVLYVTTAQIHRMPQFAGSSGNWPPAEPFRIYRFELSGDRERSADRN